MLDNMSLSVSVDYDSDSDSECESNDVLVYKIDLSHCLYEFSLSGKLELLQHILNKSFDIQRFVFIESFVCACKSGNLEVSKWR